MGYDVSGSVGFFVGGEENLNIYPCSAGFTTTRKSARNGGGFTQIKTNGLNVRRE